MNTNLVPLVEELKKQVVAAVGEVKADPRMANVLNLHVALNTLEATCGLPKTTLAELFGFTRMEELPITPTQFHGLKPLDAAKRYLKMKGKDGASVEEIVKALSRGGLELTSTQESELRTGLSRSTLDLSKVKDDYYVMLEFLPHIKRGKKGKKAIENGQTDIDDLLGEQEEEKETASE